MVNRFYIVFLTNRKAHKSKNNLDKPKVYSSNLLNVLMIAFSDLNGQDELIEVIWRDLYNQGLHRTPELRSSLTNEGLLAPRTSRLGEEFLNYISTPVIG